MIDMKHLENKLAKEPLTDKQRLKVLNMARMVNATDSESFVFLVLEYTIKQAQRIITEAIKNNIFFYILDNEDHVFHRLKPGEINLIKSNTPDMVSIVLPHKRQQFVSIADVLVCKDEVSSLLKRHPKPEIKPTMPISDRNRAWQEAANMIVRESKTKLKIDDVAYKTLEKLKLTLPKAVKMKNGAYVAVGTIKRNIKIIKT